MDRQGLWRAWWDQGGLWGLQEDMGGLSPHPQDHRLFLALGLPPLEKPPPSLPLSPQPDLLTQLLESVNTDKTSIRTRLQKGGAKNNPVPGGQVLGTVEKSVAVRWSKNGQPIFETTSNIELT